MRMRNEIIVATLAVVVSAGCSGESALDNPEPSPNRIEVEGLADSPLEESSPELTSPDETSPEMQFQDLTAKLQAFEASVEPVPAEKLAKLIELIKAEGVLLDRSERKIYRLVRSVNGTTYTAEADFGLNPPQNVGGIDPAWIQIYIRRPGEDHAQHVIVDGNSYYDLGLPNSGQLVNGIVDGPMGYTEGASDDFRQLQSAYTGDAWALAWLAQDVTMLMEIGAQAQADYHQAVEDILSKD